MITFLVCFALLVTAYFVYGGYLCRLCGVDADAKVINFLLIANYM